MHEIDPYNDPYNPQENPIAELVCNVNKLVKALTGLAKEAEKTLKYKNCPCRHWCPAKEMGCRPPASCPNHKCCE